MNVILFDPGEVKECGHISLTGARAVHLQRVLKVAPGHTVRIGVLDGPRGVGTVQSIGDGAVQLRGTFETMVPARPGVDLILALPRPKVMRRLWAQIAALGVGRIILTNADRVERNYFDAHVLTPECYRPLLIEGLQQACDTRLPKVSIHRQFKVLVEDVLDGLDGLDGLDELDRFSRGGLRLVADPAADRRAGAVVRQRKEERILLAIGPEGGWNDFETGLLEARGFQPVGMGRRTLRTDTACIALLALVHDAMASRG
jgi:RsmE family RNA methyltransferase